MGVALGRSLRKLSVVPNNGRLKRSEDPESPTCPLLKSLEIDTLIRENRMPNISIEIPGNVPGWNVFLAKFVSIIKDIGSLQGPSFEGYKNFLSHLDVVRQDVLTQIEDRTTVVWDRIMKNPKVDTADTEGLLTEMNEGVNESRNEILRFIEQQEADVTELVASLKSTDFIAQLGRSVRELTRRDSVSATQILKMTKNLSKEINNLYAPLEEKINEISRHL